LQTTITGLGSYLPEKILSNFDLEKLVDTSNEWILERTGVSERRILSDEESSSTMGAKAAIAAMKSADIKADSVDLIIVATCSPDGMFPSTANRVQAIIGAKNAVCFDINSACNGFLSGLIIGSSLINSNQYTNALIIGSEALSRLVDWSDRNTCVLFGDGAGAVMLEKSKNNSFGIVDFRFGSDGDNGDLLFATGPGSIKNELVKEAKIIMDGQNVFKHAVNTMSTVTKQLLKETNLTVDDIDLCIPHQANIRILNAIAKNLAINEKAMFSNVSKYGNTSAASIPIALTEAFYANMLNEGDTLLFTAFGAGLNWGSVILNWGQINNPER
tara:strand:+ start:8170 stop:9159 length:990 start_codon:yes stop_codon:yes gene_type:complete